MPHGLLTRFFLPTRPANPAAPPRFLSWACRCSGFLAALVLGSLAAAQGLAGYTVKPGDTAYSVARQAGTDVPSLLRLNDLMTPDLRPGQVLRLPVQGGAAGEVQPPAAAPTPPAPTLPALPPRSHTVQPGQTLYTVARLYGLKAAEVQVYNHLNSPDLKPGQVLLLPPGTTGPAGPPLPPPSAAAPAAVSPARHTVQPGQTLYSIARSYGLRAAELLDLNRLDRTDLRPGQVLLLPAGTITPGAGIAGPSLPPMPGPAGPVPGSAVFSPGVPLPAPPVQSRRSEVPASPVTDDPAAGPPADPGAPRDWRGLALSFLGVPYVYGGASHAGTDCSGLVVQVFGPLGLNLPRQSALQAQVGTMVEPPDLQPGDLLFFDTEGRGAVTHVGIYLGSYLGQDGAFISANSYGGQVAVNRLSEKYFAQRYLWARRVLAVQPH